MLLPAWPGHARPRHARAWQRLAARTGAGDVHAVAAVHGGHVVALPPRVRTLRCTAEGHLRLRVRMYTSKRTPLTRAHCPHIAVGRPTCRGCLPCAPPPPRSAHLVGADDELEPLLGQEGLRVGHGGAGPGRVSCSPPKGCCPAPACLRPLQGRRRPVPPLLPPTSTTSAPNTVPTPRCVLNTIPCCWVQGSLHSTSACSLLPARTPAGVGRGSMGWAPVHTRVQPTCPSPGPPRAGSCPADRWQEDP